MSNQIPGWYVDPANVNQHRYWDGSQWTENVRSAFNPMLGETQQIVNPATQVTSSPFPRPSQPQTGYIPQYQQPYVQQPQGMVMQTGKVSSGKTFLIVFFIVLGVFCAIGGIIVASIFASVSNNPPTQPGTNPGVISPTPDPVLPEPEKINLTEIAEKLGYADQIAKPGDHYKIGESFLLPYAGDNNELIVRHTIVSVTEVTPAQKKTFDEKTLPENPDTKMYSVTYEWEIVAGTPNEEFLYVGYLTYLDKGSNRMEYYSPPYDNSWCDIGMWTPEEPVVTECEVTGSLEPIQTILIGYHNSEYNIFAGTAIYIDVN